MNDHRITNILKGAREAASRETLEKFDIGQIVRTEDAGDEAPKGKMRANSFQTFTDEAIERWRASDHSEPMMEFLSREIHAFHRQRQKKYDGRYKPAKYASTQGERDELRMSCPIVGVDSEGMNYEGDDIKHGGVLYKAHATYAWCASSDDGTKPVHVLTDPQSEGLDKRKLRVETILDWLLSLADKYDPVTIDRKQRSGAIFCMFGSGYDLTMLLAQTSLKTARKVLKHKDPDNEGVEHNAPEFWGKYAFSVIPRKWIDIWELRNPDEPYKEIDGKRKIDFSRHIKLYDTFGYFQTKFEKVVEDMLKQGMATDDEKALITEMKALRGKFASVDLDKIVKYCVTECRLLASRMTQLRELFYRADIRPTSWHGPGALANAVFKKRKVARFFGDHIAAEDISEQQEWAHHSFVGGRIETLKQGYLRSAALYVYDVSSCYPAGAVELPSLASEHGEWRRLNGADLRYRDLGELLEMAEKASPVSMFKVRWSFPLVERKWKPPADMVSPEARQQWEAKRSTFTPFFPLPYRTEGGAILFPARGRSICMRDDFLAAIKWLQHFAPEFPRKKVCGGAPVVFDIDGAWIWEINEAGESVRPFDFIRDMYNQRRDIKRTAIETRIYDPFEMVLKLVINSIYGKLAQFIGEKGKIPKTANPYYGAAITAYGRRRLVEAALVNPHAIVFMATDGIVSDAPLHGFEGGLTRVKREGKDVIELGDWELNDADGGLFVGSGIYIYWKHDIDENGDPKRKPDGSIILKPVAKLRGASVKSYQTNEKGEPWLVEHTLPIWRNMQTLPELSADHMTERDQGKIRQDYKQFVTIGSALSLNRWRLAGRWSPDPGEAHAYQRTINVHNMGVKRMLNTAKILQLVNVKFTDGKTPDHIAERCYKLIPTIPTINIDPEISRPRPPKWLCEETGKVLEDEEDMAEAMAGGR
jgi:hypothetical protein